MVFVFVFAFFVWNLFRLAINGFKKKCSTLTFCQVAKLCAMSKVQLKLEHYKLTNQNLVHVSVDFAHLYQHSQSLDFAHVNMHNSNILRMFTCTHRFYFIFANRMATLRPNSKLFFDNHQDLSIHKKPAFNNLLI